ncbi:MAG: hypothetical protein JXB47_05205 [Anaerolineae bacterium]|nr:hypothetical protein [Anaerolineae bacterium]
MNSHEIVQRTLDFTGPERVARSFEPSDLAWGGVHLEEGEWHKTDAKTWERVDSWGNVWRRIDDTSKGEVVKGALSNLDDVETFPLPDFDNPERYAGTAALFAASPDKWRIGALHGFSFSMARKLRKLDQYFMDLMLEPAKIAILHDRIDEQIKIQMKHLHKAGADCVMLTEDWGTQLAMFIRPDHWRREFKPRFADLCSYAHALGLKVFMHSCGKITDIVPDLIETGIDLLQFDQPLVHGLDTLASFQENAKITFWCPVDIQKILPTKDEALIRRGATDMIDALWRGRGGFIAGWYPDPIAIGINAGWQNIASDEFLKQGVRSRFVGSRAAV